MRVLVLGSGGREHALCWRLAQCESVSKVLAAPGNPGIAEVAETYPLDIELGDRVAAFCKEHAVDLVVIGPERPLIAGVADTVRDAGVSVFGPSAYCAQIEGSKAFAKQMMLDEGVPTAKYETFTTSDAAHDYITSEYRQRRGVVVKASGEALGKGVVVPSDEAEAHGAVTTMLDERALGDAGATIVIEEQLSGEEASLLALCSGDEYRLLPTAKDYKAAYDGGVGPNTGGMGSISPGPDWADGVGETFIGPILRRFARDGTPYIGTLFCGLMNTLDGPKALEYNARFGDPETQVILPRIGGDFAELLYAAVTQKPMPHVEVKPDASVCVVIATSGYPGAYKKEVPLPNLDGFEGVQVFHAGTQLSDGKLVSNGGRVLGLMATAPTRGEARQRAYFAAERFKSREWHFRSDIGQ